MMKTLRSILACCLLTIGTCNVKASISLPPGGDWNSPATWVEGIVPGPLDAVVITGGSTVTISSPAECLSLVLQNTAASASSLAIDTNGSLDVGNGGGQVVIGLDLLAVTSASETSLTVDGTLRCGDILMTARRFAGKNADCSLRITSKTALVETSGNVVQDKNVLQGTLRNQVRFTAGGMFRIKGTFLAVDEGGVAIVNGPGTVDYCNDGPQIIAGFAYNNLILSGSGIKTAVGQVIIQDTAVLTIKDTATFAGLTPVYDTNSIIFYSGSVPQVTGVELPIVPPVGWSFWVSNVFGVTLNQSVAVPGEINLFEGKLFTGEHVLTQEGTLSRTNGYVVGNLQKTVPVGANVAQVYELGSSLAYGPLSLTFGNVATEGKLIAGSSDGDHTDIAGSKIDATKSVNVNWVLMPDESLAFDSCDALFNFDSADLDDGVAPELLIVGKLDGTWTYPDVAARSSTSLAVNGLTSFSGFQIGENGGKEVPAIAWATPDPMVYGTPITETQLNASSLIPGTITYVLTNGTVLNAGNQELAATFTPNDAANFTSVSATVTISVLQAPLSVSADSASRNAGEANPTFTGTLSGVVNGDNITASYSSSADENSPGGTYAIVPALNDPDNRLGNYNVSATEGTLTVIGGALPAMLSVTKAEGQNPQISLLGATNQLYRILASETLDGAWQEIGTATTDASGFNVYEDVDSSTATRFYRAVTP